MNAEEVIRLGGTLRQVLGLSSFPVGISFLVKGELSKGEVLQNYRYCQALMMARHGTTVLLNGKGISCPAASRAFGFSELPTKMASGEALEAFGIVGESTTGKKIFELMPHLKQGVFSAIELAPIEKASRVPDVVVVEDEVERLMWIALANLNISLGSRVETSTAVLQAVCVDATVIPYLEKRLNLSYGCYGCRDATDILPGESVLGFPLEMLPMIVEELLRLSKKAIPASRSKLAYAQIQKKV